MKIATTKKGGAIDVGGIVDPILSYFGKPWDKVTGKTRKEDVVLCRHWIAWYIKHVYPQVGLNGIGLLLGCKSHATVLHAIRRINVELKIYKSRRGELEGLHQATGVIVFPCKEEKEEQKILD